MDFDSRMGPFPVRDDFFGSPVGYGNYSLARFLEVFRSNF